MSDCDIVPVTGDIRSIFENVWTLVLFFVPSCVAVAALLVHYLFLHNPLSQLVAWDVNPVDVVVLKWIRRGLGYLHIGFDHVGQPRTVDGLQSVFEHFMLSLGDVHTGFGIAILAHGLSSIPRGITAYDWCLVVFLAGCSVVTNLATLICLEDFFRHNSEKRGWRLCLIFSMIITLAVCLVPINGIRRALSSHGLGSQEAILATNVLCFVPGREPSSLAENLGQAMLSWGVIIAFLLLLATGAVMTAVMERPTSVLQKWTKQYRGEMQESFCSENLCVRCEQRWILLVVRPSIAAWLMLRTQLDLLNSVLVQVAITAALLLWLSLRLTYLSEPGSREPLDRMLQIFHFVALTTSLAPFKPVIEHICMTWKFSLSWMSMWQRVCLTFSKPAAIADSDSQADAEHERWAQQSNTHSSEETDNSLPSRSRRRRAGASIPMRFKFYLRTSWCAKALPILGISACVGIILMFVLPMVGNRLPVEVVSLLSVWSIAFAPALVFFFSLVAMVIDERGRSTKGRALAHRISCAVFGLISVAAALDTAFGLGGRPMSYIGMAILGIAAITYVIYGTISRPGSLAKGKGISNGEVDEESALLGAKTKTRIPVRRPKRFQAHTRRLSKQSIKSYGTMTESPQLQ